MKPRDGLNKGLKWGGKTWDGEVKKKKEGDEMRREEGKNKNEGRFVCRHGLLVVTEGRCST